VRASRASRRRAAVARRGQAHAVAPRLPTASVLALHQRIGNRGVTALLDRGGAAPPIVRSALSDAGRPLEPDVRAPMEARLGTDLGAVRVHVDERAAHAAEAVDAHAFTVGAHVVFGRARYDPASATGRGLLAHELTHAVQQDFAPVPDRLDITAADEPRETAAREQADAASLGTHAPTAPARGNGGAALSRAPAGGSATALPGSFEPTAGITVDRTGSAIRITGTLEATGSEANATNAAIVENTINTFWTGSFAGGVAVTCAVKVVYTAPGGTPTPGAAQLSLVRGVMPSRYNRATGTLTLNLDEPDALTWAAAHEFGHMIGLGERYSESITSKLGGLAGMSRSATVEPGYAGTVMGETGGVVDVQTVENISAENASWLTADDQIRLWVARKSAADIAALPLTVRQSMISTLLSGWVGDDDVTAVETILAATTVADSTALKTQVGLLIGTLSSNSQRSRLRSALSTMP
jgi:Domain of unknown function (DUF4157)